MAYQPTILNGETVFRNEVFQPHVPAAGRHLRWRDDHR